MIVYKYSLVPESKIQEIKLPFGAIFLSVIALNGEIILYCFLDHPENEVMVTHRYMVIGTGWGMVLGVDDSPKFIGTVNIGSYVWHVFEVENLPFP